MSAAEHKCPQRIWSSGISSHVCGKTAAYEHEGKHFCKLHHPPTVQAKRKARDAEWNAKWAAEREVQAKIASDKAEQKRRADLFPELLSALQACLAYLENDVPLPNYGDAEKRAARAAIAKALPVTTKDAA